MVLLVTSKNEEDPFKNEGTRVVKGSYLRCQKSDLVQIQTHPSFYGYPGLLPAGMKNFQIKKRRH